MIEQRVAELERKVEIQRQAIETLVSLVETLAKVAQQQMDTPPFFGP